MTYNQWLQEHGHYELEEAINQDSTILDNQYDWEWLENQYSNYISDLQNHAYEQYKDDQLEL